MIEQHTQKTSRLTLGLLAILAILLVVNQVLIMGVGSASTTAAASSTQTQLASVDVMPKGVPEVYGNELGVSFDDVTATTPQAADATIRKMAVLDQSIELSGESLERYIAIGTQISCEHCCGAPSIITSTGQAACGCAHSYAMRGLAKHLIQNHPDMSNDEILSEMGKWKTLFFPSQITAKAKVLEEKGIELNYINLASNKYRDIEAGSDGGMVGGC